ncbi:VENN motif pre-toxin domain-containing protein, partial [uncultured Acinetobacter sp.]|uniref:VENN motif pre-toxin domain-containing protein n=1 Tax=uncultured Acinetobacter sp. TaxID=165433 RepID=UPI0025828F36
AGLSAGGAEAAAPVLSSFLYGKEAKDLTAEQKSTISSIVGLAGTALGATTGDVATTVQSGQVAQNAVENNLFGVITNDSKFDKQKNNYYFQALHACQNAECEKNVITQNALAAMKNVSKVVDVNNTNYKIGDIVSDPKDASGLRYLVVNESGVLKAKLLPIEYQVVYSVNQLNSGRSLVQGGALTSLIANTIKSGHDLFSDKTLFTKQEITALDRVFAGLEVVGNTLLIGGSVLPKKISIDSSTVKENNFYRDNDSITETFNYGKTISIDPTRLSFSQATVSHQKGGKAYNYNSMVDSMKRDGWNGDPVDIVIMPNGTATSMDNTRILAAREANIDVKAKVRDFNTPLTKAESERFKVNGKTPNTWGEAIKLRVEKQASQKGTPDNWSIQFPYGSIFDPKVIKSK